MKNDFFSKVKEEYYNNVTNEALESYSEFKTIKTQSYVQRNSQISIQEFKKTQSKKNSKIIDQIDSNVVDETYFNVFKGRRLKSMGERQLDFYEKSFESTKQWVLRYGSSLIRKKDKRKRGFSLDEIMVGGCEYRFSKYK